MSTKLYKSRGAQRHNGKEQKDSEGGNDGGGGSGGGKEPRPTPTYPLEEWHVGLSEKSHDEVLDMVIQARAARGEDLPDWGKKKKSAAAGASQTSEGDIAQEAPPGVEALTDKEKQRLKRRLLRQLLRNTRAAIEQHAADKVQRERDEKKAKLLEQQNFFAELAATTGAPGAATDKDAGKKDKKGKKAVPDKDSSTPAPAKPALTASALAATGGSAPSATVRLVIAHDKAMHKSKPVVLDRASTRLSDLLKLATAKLSAKKVEKGAGKGALWCYMLSDAAKTPLQEEAALLIDAENGDTIVFTNNADGDDGEGDSAKKDKKEKKDKKDKKEKKEKKDKQEKKASAEADDDAAGSCDGGEADAGAGADTPAVEGAAATDRGVSHSPEASHSPDDDDDTDAPAPTEEEQLIAQERFLRSWWRDRGRRRAFFSDAKDASPKAKDATTKPPPAAMMKQRQSLPAWQKRKDVVDVIDNNLVTVVTGATGSGKTTQVPQFLLDAHAERGGGGPLGIVCTQPRRIAATSIAERVSAERGEVCGAGRVGYCVRFDTKYNPQRTRLLFCTTGVLVAQLAEHPTLPSVTHLILDEVHERTAHVDFILTLIRDRMRDGSLHKGNFRLVLMSATASVKVFQAFFADCGGVADADGPSFEVPVVNVEGRTFPVDVKYLHDVEMLIGRRVNARNLLGSAMDGMTAAAPGGTGPSGYRNLNVHDGGLGEWLAQLYGPDEGVLLSPEVDKGCEIDAGLVAEVVVAIVAQGQRQRGGGKGAQHRDPGSWREGSPGADLQGDRARGILVFLPGIQEITAVHKALERHPECGSALSVFLLHSQLPGGTQSQIFSKLPAGRSRVILATNIAETSLTVPDITDVVDVGQLKETRYNPKQEVESLRAVWESQANATQRAGRAGRTSHGTCWRLYPEAFYSTCLAAQPVCELRRSSLVELVLALSMSHDDLQVIPAVLDRTPEPPAASAVRAAISRLVEIGAFRWVREPKQPLRPRRLLLTPLGFQLARMPVAPQLAKLMVMGAILGCSEECITIAASLSDKSIFSRPFMRSGGVDQQKEAEVRAARDKAYGERECDFTAACRAFSDWAALPDTKRGAYAAKYCLNLAALRSVGTLRENFARSLRDLGFVGVGRDVGDAGSKRKRETLAKCALVAAMYPNLAQVQSAASAGRFVKKGQPRTKQTVVLSTTREAVRIHPSSLNSHTLVDAHEDMWVVFNKNIHTSASFLCDTSFVNSVEVMLFASAAAAIALEKPKPGQYVASKYDIPAAITIDDRVKFTCSFKTAVTCSTLRQEIDALIFARILDPASTEGRVHAASETVINAVYRLLKAEAQ